LRVLGRVQHDGHHLFPPGAKGGVAGRIVDNEQVRSAVTAGLEVPSQPWDLLGLDVCIERGGQGLVIAEVGWAEFTDDNGDVRVRVVARIGRITVVFVDDIVGGNGSRSVVTNRPRP
jgi:hypothetical protein